MTKLQPRLGGSQRKRAKLSRRIGIALVVAVLTGACSSATGETESTDDQPSTAGFAPCGDGAECAVFEVPIDYATPDGPSTEIHVTLHQARGERIGAIFLNPGGPGGSVEDMVKGISNFGPPPLSDRFDIVGVDPRGTGKSTPVLCNDNWMDDVERGISVEDGLVDDIDAFLEDFDEMATTCEERYGVDYLASLTTENAARDIETVRIALGGEPLNYLGYSYGTAIGSVYATLFPNSIRSMVLDGAVPNAPASNTVELRGEHLEQALLQLDRSCELWDACPVGDAGLLESIETVRAQLRAGDSLEPLSLLTFEKAIGLMVAIRPAMQDVAQGLANALDGDGGLVHDIGSSQLTPIEDGGYAEVTSVGAAIICADGWEVESATADEILDQAETTAAAFPNVGPGWETPCDRWPVTGEGIMPAAYSGDAPLLVVGTTDDAITPYEWSEQLADELGPNATLLSWNGSDHTVAFSGSSRCIDDAVLAYLTELIVPDPGTTCVLRGLMGIGHNEVAPIIIDRITPGSPAEAADLRLGDIIISEDGTVLETVEDFVIGAAGDVVELVIERDGETMTVEVRRGTPVWELWRTDEAG